jgi:hypothetical protein
VDQVVEYLPSKHEALSSNPRKKKHLEENEKGTEPLRHNLKKLKKI